VRSELSIGAEFQVVMDDDGSSLSSEVLSDIIEEGERIGTLMILLPSEIWTKPRDGRYATF